MIRAIQTSLLKIFLLSVFSIISFSALAQNAWVNEFHYNNAGTDVNEFVEVVIENAGNYNLADWRVNFYGGTSKTSYLQTSLSTFTLGGVDGKFSIYHLTVSASGSMIRNGVEGIALSYQGTLVQFISYGGSFTALDGPALGVTSVNIGVEENESTPAGLSLQLSGIGGNYQDFTWQTPAAHTMGAMNTGQTLISIDRNSKIIDLGNAATGLSSVADTEAEAFSLLSFRLEDVGGDGYPTALSKVAFVFNSQTSGFIQDADGKRVEDLFADLFITNASNVKVPASAITFPDYKTVVLEFAPGALTSSEGTINNFSLKGYLKKSTEAFKDNNAFTVSTLLSSFASEINSSRLSKTLTDITTESRTIEVNTTKYAVVNAPGLIKGKVFENVAYPGDAFGFTIRAVDENGNKNWDDNSNLAIEATGSDASTYLETSATLYPNLVNGEYTYTDLRYVEEQFVLESGIKFRIEVTGPLGTFQSDEILAVLGRDTKSEVTEAAASGTSNIYYHNYQEATGLTTSNAAALGTFTFKDGTKASNGVNDGLPTYLQEIVFKIQNYVNLRTIALFNGSTKIAELDVSAATGQLFTFKGLNITVPNNGEVSLTIRATFRETVTDNQKVIVSIDELTAAETGSLFKYATPGEPATIDGAVTGEDTDDINRIEVTADRLNFSVLPTSFVQTNTSFNVQVEAIDPLGNRDFDVNNTITLSKNSGPGSLVPSSSSATLSNGIVNFTVQIDQSGDYTMLATASPNTLPQAISAVIQVYYPYTYNGLLISEVTDGTNIGGSPKYIELHNASTTSAYMLDNLQIRVYTDGVTTPTVVNLAKGHTLAPGESFIISNVSFSSSWGGMFSSVTANQVNPGINGNGNDVYELYDYTQGKVLDLFGKIGEDGLGKAWDYTDRQASRKSGLTDGNKGTFNVNEFTFVPFHNASATPGSSSTKDATAPSVLSTDPADNATDILEKASISITFNEPVNFEAGNIELRRVADNSVIRSISVFSAEISGEGTQELKITPAADLPGLTDIYVYIPTGVVTDLAGISFNGFQSATAFNFKTTDTIYPTVVSLNPADDAINVELNQTFTITFSEAMKKGTGSIRLFNIDGTLEQITSASNATISGANSDIVSFTFNNPLTSKTGYYIMIDNKAFTDVAGNEFAGITSFNTWNFTTKDPFANSPQIVTLNPVNNETYVDLNVKPSIKFNKNIKKGTGYVGIYNAVYGTEIARFDINSPYVTIPQPNIIQFNFGTLALNTAYFIQVDQGAITDLSGNPFVGILDNQSWTFSTIPTTEPTVVVKAAEEPMFFGFVNFGSSSASKLYTVTGRNITGDIKLTAPANFEISKDGGNIYTSSVTIAKSLAESTKVEILVRFKPTAADGKLHQSYIVHSSPNARDRLLEVIGREGNKPEILSIAEARAIGVGNKVKVRGVVNSGESLGYDLRYMEDNSAGIAISSPDAVGLGIGDEVLVEGEIFQTYDGLLKIAGASISIGKLGNVGAPTAKQVSADAMNEANESELISIQNVSFFDAGQKFEASQNYSFVDTKGNIGILKIEGFTHALIGAKIPKTAMVTGVLTQQGTYRLLPRDEKDIKAIFPEILTSLPDGELNFGFVKANTTTDLPPRVLVTGKELVEKIKVTVDAPFEVSIDGVYFSQEVRVDPNVVNKAVFVRFSPKVANGQVYKSHVVLSSNSAPSVSIPVAGVEGTQPDLLTIEQARTMKSGSKVTVEGIVTSNNSVGVTNKYFEDGTAGIVVVKAGDTSVSGLNIGDRIKVTGKLASINNLLQINKEVVVELIQANVTNPGPKTIVAKDFNEDNEAELVKIENITFEAAGKFEAGKNYLFTFPTGEKGAFYVPTANHPLIGVRIPLKADVTGLISQSSDVYQILPRSAEDLQDKDALISTELNNGDLEFFFVPANTKSNAISYLVSGSRLQGDITVSVNAPFEVSSNGTNFSSFVIVPKGSATNYPVYVRYAPTIAGGSVNEEVIKHETSNGRVIEVPVIGIEGTRPSVLTISQARALGDGENVTVKGVVTTNGQLSTTRRYFQDATGGIVVEAASNTTLTGTTMGDEIQVSGVIRNVNGQLVIKEGVSINVTQANKGVPAAQLIVGKDRFNETNESELLEIKGIQFVEPGIFKAGPYYEFYFESGEIGRVRISNSSHPLMGSKVPDFADIIGVLSQKGEYYELLPRNATDLKPISYKKAILVATRENGLDLGMAAAGSATAAETFAVTGVELTDNITVSVTAPFEISKDGTSFSQIQTIPNTANNLKIYVRFRPTVSSGLPYNAEVKLQANGLLEKVQVFATEGKAPTTALGPNYEEKFDQCFDLNSFSRYDLGGSLMWQCAEGFGVGQSGGVTINNLNNDPGVNEDWLISPMIEIFANSKASFQVERRNQGTPLKLLISTDYVGSGNPNKATWTDLKITFPEATDAIDDFTLINEIVLGAYAGKNVYFAFKYVSDYDATSTFTIDDFVVTSVSEIAFAESAKTIKEGESYVVKLPLSVEASADGMVKIAVSHGTEVKYGASNDFVTTPLISADTISIAVSKYAKEISFSLDAIDDKIDEAEEKITFTIAKLTSGLRVNEAAKTFELTIKSENTLALSIADLRQTDANGVATYEGEKVKVEGVVHGPNLFDGNASNAIEFRLINPSGSGKRGITVRYSGTNSLGYVVTDGDLVEIIGVVKTINGLATIDPQLVTVKSSGQALVSAGVVADLNETSESDLVKLEGVRVVSGWQVNASSSFDVVVENKQGKKFTVRILNITNIFGTEQPERFFSIVGYGSQNDGSAPHTEGYYLIPRSLDDINVATGLDDKHVDVNLLPYPNPTNDVVKLKGDLQYQVEEVHVLDLSGKVIRTVAYTPDLAIEVRDLHAGVYILKIKMKDGKFTTKRITIAK